MKTKQNEKKKLLFCDQILENLGLVRECIQTVSSKPLTAQTAVKTANAEKTRPMSPEMAEIIVLMYRCQ